MNARERWSHPEDPATSQTVEIDFRPANGEQQKAEIRAELKYVAMQHGSGEGNSASPAPLLLGVLSQEGWCEGASGTRF